MSLDPFSIVPYDYFNPYGGKITKLPGADPNAPMNIQNLPGADPNAPFNIVPLGRTSPQNANTGYENFEIIDMGMGTVPPGNGTVPPGNGTVPPKNGPVPSPPTKQPPYQQQLKYPMNPYLTQSLNPPPTVEDIRTVQTIGNALGVDIPILPDLTTKMQLDMADNQRLNEMGAFVEPELAALAKQPAPGKPQDNTSAQYGESGTGEKMSQYSGYGEGLRLGLSSDMMRFNKKPPLEFGGYPSPEQNIPANISPEDYAALGIPTLDADGNLIGVQPLGNKTILDQQLTENPELQDPTVDQTVDSSTNTPTNKTTQSNTTYSEQPGGFTPEKYYAFKGLLDAGALFHNMVQGPPPNLSLKLPQMNRIRMDRTPYEQQRTDIERMGQQSYRKLREGISQSSDLMKGLAAVTTGTQEAMRQVGTAEAQQELQVEQANQQIAAQENQMQTQLLNQEQQMNYQLQDQAQKFKDQMISQQLGRIGDTAGAYANYLYNKEQANKATQLFKEQANLVNDIQLKWMQYEVAQKELGTPEYMKAEDKAALQFIQETQNEMLESEKYKDLKEQLGSVKYTDFINRAKDYDYNQRLIQQAQQKIAQEPKRLDSDTDEVWNQKMDLYTKQKEQYEKMSSAFEQQKALFQKEKEFWEEGRTKFTNSTARQDFRSSYLAERGLPTTAEFSQSIESLMSAARQL